MKIRYNSALSALLGLLCLTSACARFGRPFTGSRDKGGMYLILSIKSPPAQLDSDIEQTMTVMQKRCNDLSIYCKLERLGGDRVKLSISDPANPERVKSILLSEGLEIRAVVSPQSPSSMNVYSTQAEAEAAAGKENDVLPYEQGNDKKFLVLERTPIVTGQNVVRAEAVQSTYDRQKYDIHFTLNEAGAKRFGDWTGQHINSYVAIVLNRQVRSTAYIKSAIYDQGEITGAFSKEEAEDVALVLMSGNLPAHVEALEEGTYKP